MDCPVTPEGDKKKTVFDAASFAAKWKFQVEEMPWTLKMEFLSKQKALVAEIQAGATRIAPAREALSNLARDFVQEARMRKLKQILPAEFLKPIEPQQLKNPYAHEQAMNWDSMVYTDEDELEPTEESLENVKKGIVAYGGTGQGKTRSLTALLSKLYLEEGPDRQFEFVRTVDLAATIRRLAPRHGADLEKYMDHLMEIPILLLDDLHQAKLTLRYAEELMRLVDTRTSSDGGLLLFVTCQMPGEELVKAMVGREEGVRQAAEAIVRRLRDYCIPVDFDYIPQTTEASQ